MDQLLNTFENDIVVDDDQKKLREIQITYRRLEWNFRSRNERRDSTGRSGKRKFPEIVILSETSPYHPVEYSPTKRIIQREYL